MPLRITHYLAIGGAAVAIACASQPPVTTTTMTSSGDVAMNAGMWMDDVGGTWMDANGAYRMGGATGTGLGLQAADVTSLNNANIVAHLAAGDSLEVALSQLGVSRAQNQAVRDFAQRMVNEHTAHMQMGMQMAQQGGITPMPSPLDTADARMAMRMTSRLQSMDAGAGFDRQFMRAEVMMHQHMLHELNLVRPQATGVALQLVDHTIPVVQQHLRDAQSLWQQVGGSSNNGNNGNNNSSLPSNSSTPSSTSTPSSSNP
jgi:putative membrane protein